VVPVLRNVETMNYAEVEKGIHDLGVKVSLHMSNLTNISHLQYLYMLFMGLPWMNVR